MLKDSVLSEKHILLIKIFYTIKIVLSKFLLTVKSLIKVIKVRSSDLN